jgi:hypothetical protein
LKYLFRQQRFSILAAVLLMGLLLLTLPVSYALWREALGVTGNGTTGNQSVAISSVVTVTPIDISAATPGIASSDQVVTIIPTDVPTTELAPTNPPPTEQPIAADQLATELPTELPIETSTPTE